MDGDTAGADWDNLILLFALSLVPCPKDARICPLPCTERLCATAQRNFIASRNVMAEDIHIPSPSVFLRASPSPPPKPRDDQPPVAKNARRQSSNTTTNNTTKKAPAPRKQSNATAADGAPKPKQSKSRNGTYLNANLDEASSTEPRRDSVWAFKAGDVLIGRIHRLCNVQGQTTEMRRRETRMPAVRKAKGRVRRLQEGLQMAPV